MNLRTPNSKQSGIAIIAGRLSERNRVAGIILDDRTPTDLLMLRCGITIGRHHGCNIHNPILCRQLRHIADNRVGKLVASRQHAVAHAGWVFKKIDGHC